MRFTLTLADQARRDQAIDYIANKASPMSRVMFLDPERSDAQAMRIRLMREEISRRIKWNGERLSADDWRVMFAASLRRARVVDGIDPGTRVALGVREDGDPSKEEASEEIELMHSFAAERGVILE
jgi:hypothetical protein